VPRLTSPEGRRALWASHAVIDQTRPASAGARCSAACARRSAAARPPPINPQEAQPSTARPHRRLPPAPSRASRPPPHPSKRPMVGPRKLGLGRTGDRPAVRNPGVRAGTNPRPSVGRLTMGFPSHKPSTGLWPIPRARRLDEPSRSGAGAVAATRSRTGSCHGIGRGVRARVTWLSRPPPQGMERRWTGRPVGRSRAGGGAEASPGRR